MINTGFVTRCEGKYAYVKITRGSMCGENCGSCNMCSNKELEIKALNKENAQKGDRITLEMPEISCFSAAFLAYGGPMALLLLGIIIGAIINMVETVFVVTLGIIILWYVALMFMEKNKKYSGKFTPVIIEIVKEEKDA